MQIVACFEEHVYLSKHLQKATYLHMSFQSFQNMWDKWKWKFYSDKACLNTGLSSVYIGGESMTSSSTTRLTPYTNISKFLRQVQ